MNHALLLSAFLLAAPAFVAAAPAESQKAFAALSDEYWEQQMRLSPLSASFINHPRYHERLDDNSALGRADDLATARALQAKLKAIDRAALGEVDRISYEVMSVQLENWIEQARHKFWQWNVDHMDGPQSWIPTVVAVAQPMKDEAAAEALLLRIKSVPGYFASHVANLREGLREGRVAAKVPVQKAIGQLNGLLKTPAKDSPYLEAVKRLPEGLRPAYAATVQAAVETHVYPSYRQYRDFLKNEYLPKARATGIGLSKLPGGVDAYKYQIRYHTTVERTPEELHAIGLEELRGIHAEMKTIAARMQKPAELRPFLDWVRKEPAHFFATREQVLQNAEELVARAKAKLPEYFGTLPKTDLIVKPIEDYKEKNDVAARYFPPPDDLSRPGIYFINTYEPRSRPRFSMASLAVHEGVPGHHMQIAIALEQRGLPAFRRNAGFTAYVEGWALYSERLGDEMGLYQDDLSRVGMLSDQALRASRLVVDTGLHAMGWERQQAIDFMKANTPMSEEEIIAEVDRYTIWPGQALAYKVGQREIMAIRQESKAQLGDAFDIRRFHDLVLKNGAVPLSVLRQSVLGVSSGAKPGR